MADPASIYGAIIAASGTVTAVFKGLSRRSGLSRYIRRRDEEYDIERATNNERWRAIARHHGGETLERDFMVIEARQEAQILALRERHHPKLAQAKKETT